MHTECPIPSFTLLSMVLPCAPHTPGVNTPTHMYRNTWWWQRGWEVTGARMEDTSGVGRGHDDSGGHKRAMETAKRGGNRRGMNRYCTKCRHMLAGCHIGLYHLLGRTRSWTAPSTTLPQWTLTAESLTHLSGGGRVGAGGSCIRGEAARWSRATFGRHSDPRLSKGKIRGDEGEMDSQERFGSKVTKVGFTASFSKSSVRVRLRSHVGVWPLAH